MGTTTASASAVQGDTLVLAVSFELGASEWKMAFSPGLGQQPRLRTVAAGDLEAAMEIDLEVWAPLGADDRIRQLWRATPDANPLPDGVEAREPTGAPAKERLGELAVPTLIVTAAHDPAGMREIGPLVARSAPEARHVELDSDHYVTLREPELLSRVLLDFLTATAPKE